MAKRVRRSGGGLDRMSIADLQREIAKRARQSRSLLKRRQKAAEKLARLDAQIRALSGSSAGALGGGGDGRRRRLKNDMSLSEAMVKLLRGKTMRMTDIAEGVLRSGYMTNAKNFRSIVNQALIKHTKVFKKVGRGLYTTA